MSLAAHDCCVLNEGNGAWAFEPLATQLASNLGIEVATKPRRFNYLLQVETGEVPAGMVQSFAVLTPQHVAGTTCT